MTGLSRLWPEGYDVVSAGPEVPGYIVTKRGADIGMYTGMLMGPFEAIHRIEMELWRRSAVPNGERNSG